MLTGLSGSRSSLILTKAQLTTASNSTGLQLHLINSQQDGRQQQQPYYHHYRRRKIPLQQNESHTNTTNSSNKNTYAMSDPFDANNGWDDDDDLSDMLSDIDLQEDDVNNDNDDNSNTALCGNAVAAMPPSSSLNASIPHATPAIPKGFDSPLIKSPASSEEDGWGGDDDISDFLDDEDDDEAPPQPDDTAVAPTPPEELQHQSAGEQSTSNPTTTAAEPAPMAYTGPLISRLAMFFPPDNTAVTTTTRPEETVEESAAAVTPTEEGITDGWENDEEYDDLDLINDVVVTHESSLSSVPTGEEPPPPPTEATTELVAIMDNIPAVSPHKPQFDDSQMAIIGWSEDEHDLSLDDAVAAPSGGRVTPPPASGNSMLSAELGAFDGISPTPIKMREGASVEELGLDLITRSPLGQLKKKVECLPALPVEGDDGNDSELIPKDPPPTPLMNDMEQGSLDEDAWDDDNLDLDDADLDITEDHIMGPEETLITSNNDQQMECPKPPTETTSDPPLTAKFKQVNEIITYDHIKPPSESLRQNSQTNEPLDGQPKNNPPRRTMLSHQDSGNDAVIGIDENLSHLDELGLGDAIVEEDKGTKLVFDLNLDLTAAAPMGMGEAGGVAIAWDAKELAAPPQKKMPRDSTMAVIGWNENETDLDVAGLGTNESAKEPPMFVTEIPTKQAAPLRQHRDSSVAVIGWNENETDLDVAGLGDDVKETPDEPSQKKPYELQHVDSSLAVIGWNETDSDLDAAGLGDDESDVIASAEEGLPSSSLLKIIDEVPSFDEDAVCPKLETTCDSSGLRIPQGDGELYEDVNDDIHITRSEEGWNDDGLDELNMIDDVEQEPNRSQIDYDIEQVDANRYTSQTAVTGEQTEEGWNDDDLNLSSTHDASLEDGVTLPHPTAPRDMTIESTPLNTFVPPGTGEETTEQHPIQPPPNNNANDMTDGWDDDDDAINDLDIPDEERPSDDHNVDRMSVPSDVIASDRLLVPSGTGEETEEGWPGDSLDNLNLGDDDVMEQTIMEPDGGPLEEVGENRELTIPTGASVTPTAAVTQQQQHESIDFSLGDVMEEGRQAHSETLVVPTGDDEEEMSGTIETMENGAGGGVVSNGTVDEGGSSSENDKLGTAVACHYDLTSLLEHQSAIIEKLESCKSRLTDDDDDDLSLKINSIISELIFYYEQYNSAAQDHVEKSQYQQQQETLINELQSQLDNRDTICSELRHQIDDLKKQSHEWAEKESSLNSQIDALNETITAMTATHAKELSSVTERLDSQIEVSRQSLVQSQTLQKAIDQIENEVKDAAMKEEELNELKIKYIVLQEKYEKQVEKIVELDKSRHKERSQYEEQLGKSQIVQEELAESKEQLEMALQRQKELSTQMQQNQTTISSMKKQLSTMKVQKDELKWQYDDSITRCNKQKSKIDSLLKENKKNEELAVKRDELYRALSQETSQLKKDMQAKYNRVVKKGKESETKLKEQVSQKNASIKQFQKKLRAVMKEKKQMVADNEELYVQLGYLRQQQEMEAERHNVEIQNLEQIAQEKKVLLEEIERLQSCAVENDESTGIGRDVYDGALEDNKQLRDELTSMTEALSQMETQRSDAEGQLLLKDEQIANLSQENQTLMQQVENITSHLSEEDAMVRTKDCYEERLQSMNDQYAALQVELKNLALEMKNTKEALSTLAPPSNQSEEATSFGFLQRIQTLNRQIERLNQAFDRQMQEIDRNSELILTLQNEKHNSESFVLDRKEQEIELYKQQIQKIGADLETSKKEATEYMKLSLSLKQNVEEANLQLSEKADKIQQLENKLLQCDGDGNDVRSNDDAIIMQQKRELMELKQLIENKDAQLDDLVSDKQSMEAKLKQTREELESSRVNVEALSSDNSSSIEAMKKQLMAAEDEVTKSNSRNDDLEQRVEERDARIKELEKQNDALKAALEEEQSKSKLQSSNSQLTMDKIQHDLAAKEQEMLQSHIQIEAYKGELKACQLSLDAKEREISSLLGKLEEFKQEQQVEIDLTSHILNGSSASDDDDSTAVEILRKQVISLAKAVERAETQRAEALERVAKERKMNADNLRRIGDSVRKFYSSYSDKIQ